MEHSLVAEAEAQVFFKAKAKGGFRALPFIICEFELKFMQMDFRNH